jgi:hypothetical protein
MRRENNAKKRRTQRRRSLRSCAGQLGRHLSVSFQIRFHGFPLLVTPFSAAWLSNGIERVENCAASFFFPKGIRKSPDERRLATGTHSLLSSRCPL